MGIVAEIFFMILSVQIAVFVLFNIFTLWASKKPSGILKATKQSYKIALVIPCYNEERIILNKLDNSFSALSFNDESNVYVLDDSNDDTFKLAEEYRVNHNVQNLFVWKNPLGKGKPKALNWIFRRLEEDIIVITDADALLEKNAIAELILNFSDPKVGAVTGKLVAKAQNNFTRKDEGLYRKVSELWRKAESNIDSCLIFNGPLMAFRGELSHRFKLDENIDADDTDLVFKIRRLGYRSVYEPQAAVTEYISDSLTVRMNQEIRRARGLSRVFLNNVSMIGRFGCLGKVIYIFSFFNYIFSPILTVILLFLLPFVIAEYVVLLVLFSLLLVPIVRIAIFGYLYRQMALVLGLITPSKGKWKPNRG